MPLSAAEHRGPWQRHETGRTGARPLHQRALVDLPATVEGPAAARRVVSAVLLAWGLDTLDEDARLVVSELVTNAVLHAADTVSLELELERRGESGLRIALADGSSVRPIIEELDDEATSGRGLRIVEMLSTRWGADDHGGGKRVWVELDDDEL